VVVLLKDAPEVEAVKALQTAISGLEIVRAKGRHAYIVFPHGIGRSRVTNTLIERSSARGHGSQLEHRHETGRPRHNLIGHVDSWNRCVITPNATRNSSQSACCRCNMRRS
jgi:hypothetical protein